MKTLLSFCFSLISLTCVATYNPATDNLTKSGSDVNFAGKARVGYPSGTNDAVNIQYFNDNAGGGGIAGVTNRNVNYVTKGGNDSTALSNRLDKPFLLMGRAQTNSPSGGLIQVSPGTYSDEIFYLTNSINWILQPGVTVSSTNTTFFLDDRNEAVNARIVGHGSLIANRPDELQSFIRITNPASRVLIEVDSINRTTTVPDEAEGQGWLIDHFDGVLNVKANSMVSTNGSGYGAIHWKNGDLHVAVNTITNTSADVGAAAIYSASPDETPTGSFYFTGDYIEAGMALQITGSGDENSAKYRNWISVKEIKVTGGGGVYDAGFLFERQKSYLDSQKISGTNLTSEGSLLKLGSADTQSVWARVQKTTSSGRHLTVLGGDFIGEIMQIEDVNNTTSEAFYQSAGSIDLSFQTAILGTNASGINHAGGTAVYRNGTINTTASINPTNASPVYVSASGLTLKNVTLVAPAGQPSVKADDPATVTIDGVLTVNTTPSSDVTFTGGTLIVTGGAGSPEGVVTAPWGSRYQQASSTNRWVKDSFAGNTGWINK